MEKIRYLSLFSGIGGFELGIQQAYESMDNRGTASPSTLAVHGDKSNSNTGNGDGRGTNPVCVGYSEIDKYAIQIYEQHFNHTNYGDITKINTEDLPEFDLLVGGFPCQSFSIAGKRGGFNDTRGTLFFEIARILKAKQPNLLFLENVKGLLSHDEGRTFATIISTLDELGYDLQWQVLNSKNFGVPQNRERVFIVGHLRGTSRPKVFPFGEANESDIQQTKELPVQISNTLRTNYSNGFSNETYIQSNQSGLRQIRELPDNPDRGGGQTYPADFRIRRLTPTECERLQGFPDGWTEGVSDTQRYKTLGNAVTVNVIREVVKSFYGNLK